MKSTGILRKVDQLGRIVIPKELRKSLEIYSDDSIEMYLEEEFILIKKHNLLKPCIITGKVSDKNKEYANGLTLSPEGARILLEKLEEKMIVSNK